MAKSDGSVIIDTRMDTSGFGKGIADAKQKVSSFSGSLNKLGNTIKNTFSESNSTNVGKSYEQLQREIAKAEERLDKLIEKQIRFTETGGNIKSRTFEGMEYDIEMARNKLFELRGELEKTEKTAPKSMNLLKKGVDNTTKSIKKMGNTAKKSNYSLLKMLGTSLLFSTVFRAISAVTQGFTDGLNNLVQYSDEANYTMSSLKSSLTQLKNSFATAFMPLITLVTPILNKFIALIIKANNLIAQFFSALAGKNTYTKAVAVQEDYAASLDKTADSAKKAQKYLSGLDEIRTFTDTEENKSTEVSPQNMFEEVAIDSSIFDFIELIKKIIPRMKELVGLFKEGFAEGLGDTEYRLQSLKDSVASIKDSFAYIFDDELADGFNSALDRVVRSLGVIAGSFVSIGLTIATNLVGGFSKYMEDNKERIKQYLLDMFDIGAAISEKIGELSSTFAYIFEEFASEAGQQLTANLIEIFANSFMEISSLAAQLGLEIVSTIVDPIANSKEELKAALGELLVGYEEFTTSVKEILNDSFGFVRQLYDEFIAPLFETLREELTKFYQDNIAPLATTLGEFFSSLGQNLTKLWNELLKPIIQWVIDNILPVLQPIFDGVIKRIMNLYSMISGIVQGLITVLGGLITFIVGVFTGDWEHAWEGIKDIFKGIFNTLASIIEGFVNSAIDAINGLIGGVNKISSNIGITAIPTIPEFNIPMLATGAVIPPNAPFMAVLGDQRHGTNIEAPLDTIKQAVREVVGNGAGGQYRFSAQINRRVLFEEFIEEAKLQMSMTGHNPLDLRT